MTMTLEPNQQRYAIPFESMSSSYSAPHPHPHPQFTNPWPASPQSHAMYAGSAQVAHGGMPSHNHIGLDRHSQQPSPRGPATTNAPLAQYGSVPVTSASAGSPLSTVDPSLFAIGQADFLSGSPNLHADSQDLLFDHKDLMSMSRLAHATTAGYPDTTYHTATAASPAHTTYASSPPSYEAMAYPRHHNFAIGPDHHADAQSRRYSQSSVSSSASSYDQVDLAAAAMPLPLPHAPPRSSHIDFRTGRGIPNDGRGFHNDVEVGQMMVNMKFEGGDQETPRAGVYNNRGRGSGDSYGFPSTHSNTSSISSAGFSPYSYQGSVDGSEYSTGASEIDSVGSRTLPPPQGLMSTQQPQGLMSTQMPTQQPPPAASMMSQFSSKAKDSTQKKHKCKICDKRFTRPSSLQTHVYSHTGERPFKCDVPSCGRLFSVVSNLRRHGKVHMKDHNTPQTPSEADSSEDASEDASNHE